MARHLSIASEHRFSHFLKLEMSIGDIGVFVIPRTSLEGVGTIGAIESEIGSNEGSTLASGRFSPALPRLGSGSMLGSTLGVMPTHSSGVATAKEGNIDADADADAEADAEGEIATEAEAEDDADGVAEAEEELETEGEADVLDEGDKVGVGFTITWTAPQAFSASLFGKFFSVAKEFVGIKN